MIRRSTFDNQLDGTETLLNARNNLLANTSRQINNHKVLNAKQNNFNKQYLKTCASNVLMQELFADRDFTVVLKINFKPAGNNCEFLNNLCVGGADTITKIVPLTGNPYLEKMLVNARYLFELFNSGSLYYVQLKSEETYLNFLRKCFELELLLESEHFFSFNVICSREKSNFINFNKNASENSEIREIYKKHITKHHILFEVCGVIHSSSVDLGAILSSKITQNSVFFPYNG